MFVIALLVNCTGEDPLIKPIKAGIDSQNYTAALAAADSAIAMDPMNATAYFYKGVALGKVAKGQTAMERQSTYEQMRASLDKAESLYEVAEEPAAESGKITNEILAAWGLEHNKAIEYINVDSVKMSVENNLEYSIAHLVNATTVNTDSSLSFDVLAQVYYMNKEFSNAAASLKYSIGLQEQASSSDYDRLSSYYFLSENPDDAVTTIEEGLKIYPDSTVLVQKLADGLFQIDRPEEALNVMERLIESDPTNARYYLIVGTRVYQRVLSLDEMHVKNSEKIADLEANNGDATEIEKLKSDNTSLKTEIESLTNRAEAALLKSAELDETIATTFNTLGILYQNKSAALFDLRNNTTDLDESDRYDELAKEEVRKSMSYYEKAAEIDPDNTGYWESLFRIYMLLDMRDKAEDAMNKAGM